jgi:HTH-type transcriptional regulator/antitoxin HigA
MSTKALSINYVNPKTKHTIKLPVDIFKKPSNAKEYAHLEKVLDCLIDEVRNNEKHPLAIVMEIIGDNLEAYDDKHAAPIGKDVSDIELVKYLMEKHHLNQNDLAPIFGNQANVSKFLNEKRTLSKSQIVGLKNKFGISADFFMK